MLSIVVRLAVVQNLELKIENSLAPFKQKSADNFQIGPTYLHGNMVMNILTLEVVPCNLRHVTITNVVIDMIND